MAVKLNGSTEKGDVETASTRFPYANWGPLAAILGVVAALFAALVVAVPVAIVDHPPSADELSTAANAITQLGQELAFLLVPFGLAMMRGATSVGEAAGRLGLRRFKPSALLWVLAAMFTYLALAVAYVAIFGEPKQEDIAEKLGPVAVQVLLIAIVVPICEETCFRGMLFGGLRERMPRFAAALVSGLIFGALHATTGVTAVPPLMIFGVILALLYEKTGSIVPGIILHMLNNSIALLGQ
jgi:membrane protease YdiL (CAAX protease family)